MGLHKGDLEGRDGRWNATWVAVIWVAVLAGVIGLFGDAGRAWLAFDRAAIAGGEYWRLLTAHCAHLGLSHLLLNLAGLLLIAYLVGGALTAGEWAATFLLASIVVSTGLWFLQPGLERYVGLSGVLHGLLAAGLVATAGRWGIDLWIVAIALVAKLAYEQLAGPMPVSQGLSGGRVIIDAHLYGAVAGCAAGAWAAIRVRGRASI